MKAIKIKMTNIKKTLGSPKENEIMLL